MVQYDLNIGAQVRCTDGTCGRLLKVVIDPQTERVTDLVVERGFLLTTDRVVPTDVVRRAAGEEVHLDISSQDLADYPEYRDVEFEEPAPAVNAGVYGRDHVRCWSGGYRLACRSPVIPMVRREVHEGVSPTGAVIERGTPVRNQEGQIGHVDHLLVDPEDGKVTHLVMRRGILAYYPILPVSAIRLVSDGAVTVSLNEEEVKDLPRFKRRAAEDIEADLQARLEALRGDGDRVQIAAEGGIVRLTGWVPDVLAKRRLEAVARSVEGVIDVENELATGVSVRTSVRHALLSDPRTSLSRIEVIDDRGIVTLKGEVDGAEVRAAAEEIAAAQPGVVSVVNALEVQPDTDTPFLQGRLLAGDEWLNKERGFST